MSEMDNVKPSFLNQETEGTEIVDANLPQCQLESTSAAGHQEVEPSCINKTLEDEIHVGAIQLPSQDARLNVTTFASLANSQSEGLTVDPDTNTSQNGQAEIPAMECSRSPSQTQMDLPQTILPISACASAANGGKENPPCYLEGDRENNHKRGNDMGLADVTTVTNEEEGAFPPKKKQCVEESAEQIRTEQSGMEMQPQPTTGPEDSRKEAHSSVLTSDETSVSCGPGCVKTCEDQEQQTMNLTDAAGLEFLDYVSDSQLNTIPLTEDLKMEVDHPPECPDATDLICGLAQELSALNQKIMAAHRDLENLHRSSKSSRSSLR